MNVKKKTFFNTTTVHRFNDHFFKLFSPQSNAHTDFDSEIDTPLLLLLNQNLSLDTCDEHNKTDAEKRNEVIFVFTQTEFDNSSATDVSANDIFLAPHGYFSNL